MNIEQRIDKMRSIVQKFDKLKKQEDGASNLKKLLTDESYSNDILKISVGNIYTCPKEIDPEFALRLKKALVKEIDLYKEETQFDINILMEEK